VIISNEWIAYGLKAILLFSIPAWLELITDCFNELDKSKIGCLAQFPNNIEII
jgi:hypothetical protein